VIRLESLAGRFGRKLRFLLGGALNTALTYLLYLGLRGLLGYQLAYFVAYLAGIALSYLINAIVVFRRPLSWGSALAFPLVYVLQYIAGAGLLALFVEGLGLDERLAPLVVVLLLLPGTYLMTRFVLARGDPTVCK
jgi:putative flippase GtrA